MVRDTRGRIGCVAPFGKIEIMPQGAITMCCYSWLPRYCGNLLTDIPAEIMSNAVRIEVQQGMRVGDFHSCTRHCPYLETYRHTEDPIERLWPLVPLEVFDDRVRGNWYNVFLTYDQSCNLQCPSCRNGLIWHKQSDPEFAGMSQVHERAKQLIDHLLDEGHRVQLHITGSGDPFASLLYWNYMQELASKPIKPRLGLAIATNGVLMTRENLELIRPLWPSIDSMNISVDAATDETYRVVRKGGNFQKLRDNLDAFDELNSSGCFPNLSHWQTNLIVQRDNFRELKQFVEWQLGYRSLNVVWTNLIAKWGHMDDDQYAGMAVWMDGHPLRDELREILRDPVFRDSRVFLGNMTSLTSGDR